MYCSTNQRILFNRGNRYGTSIAFIALFIGK